YALRKSRGVDLGNNNYQRLSHRLTFELIDCVADFSGAFIKLLRDRSFHLALHYLELTARTFGTYFLKPFFEKMDLRTFRSKLRKVRTPEKFADRVTALLNCGDRFLKFSLSEENGGLRPRIHHQDVGPKLLQRPGKLVTLSVGIDKVEEIEVALCV